MMVFLLLPEELINGLHAGSTVDGIGLIRHALSGHPHYRYGLHVLRGESRRSAPIPTLTHHLH